MTLNTNNNNQKFSTINNQEFYKTTTINNLNSHNSKNNNTDHNKLMKIAIVAHSLYPIAQPYAGGLEMITQLLCDELVARGHNVTLFAHEDSHTKAKIRPFLSRASFEEIIYSNEHDALGMSRDELYQYVIYQDAMREIIMATQNGDYDIVHNHSLHHVPMLTGQALGTRLLTTFHTPIFAHLRLALLTLQLGTQTQFTSISQFQQRLYSEFVPSQVVYNGIDVASFDANIDDNIDANNDANNDALDSNTELKPINQEYEVKQNEEVYFWFGRICPEKGTHLAMQYCQTANKKLVIAGPKSNMDYYQKEVDPLLEQDSDPDTGKNLFTYVGHLTKAQINEQLKRSTATLFTSTWDEPYGLTLAESLACGTPIIGFDVGAGAEIVTPDTGIIVPKMDKEKFISAFNNIHKISRADCRRRAEQFCSVSAMVDGYLELYQKTLEAI